MKKQLQYIFLELAEENQEMPVWKYNDKCYPKVNDNKLLITELIYRMKLPNIKLSYLALREICLILWI